MAEKKIDFIVNGKGNAAAFFEKVGNSLKDLKGKAGAESTLGQIGGLLKGAGAVAGITLAAQAVDQFADSWAALSKAERDGGGLFGAVARIDHKLSRRLVDRLDDQRPAGRP